jgi:hypothetical protein
MRNVAIFSGASNTFGLGLELEFRDKYNDDNWLKENGLFLPLPREPEDLEYWRKYRWPKLVSDDLNLIEYNIHDKGNIMLGGNAIQTIWILLNDNKEIKELMERTKYVFLEIGYARWWDANLHGSNDGKDYPNTIIEIIDLIDNPKSDREVVRKAIEWVESQDIDFIWQKAFDVYDKLKKEYPEVQFILLPWNADYRTYGPGAANDFLYQTKNYGGMHGYLKANKLLIGDVAKAYNGDYKYNWKDEHPSSLGHRNVANMVINYINKNDALEVFEIKKTII